MSYCTSCGGDVDCQHGDAEAAADQIAELNKRVSELEGALHDAETVLGENLQWIGDQADLGVRQKDPETLRRLAQLREGWESLVRVMVPRRILAEGGKP